MSSMTSRAAASARRLRHPLRLALGLGVVLLLAGLGALAAEAQGRLDAAEVAVSFTPEESAAFGEDVDGLIASLQISALTRGLLTGADVARYRVEILESDDGNGGITIEEESQRVVSSQGMGWHAGPTTLPAFVGLLIILGSLFFGAARWHARRAGQV